MKTPVRKLEANRRWKAANKERANQACSAWHEARKAEGINVNRLYARDPAAVLLSKARTRAKQFGREFTLTRAWLDEALAPMTCEATGLPLSFDEGEGGPRPWVPSIDRRESSQGYTPDNCQIVCWAYNLAKSNWDASVPLILARALLAKTM